MNGKIRRYAPTEKWNLVRILQHAYSVIPSDKSFIQRPIGLLSSVKSQHHHARHGMTPSGFNWPGNLIPLTFILQPRR